MVVKDGQVSRRLRQDTHEVRWTGEVRFSMRSLLPLFSVPMQRILSNLPNEWQEELQEIRVRQERPLELIRGAGYGFVQRNGSVSPKTEQAYRPSQEECRTLLEMLTQHSLYTFEEELKRGFITVSGGHRVGLAGRTLVEQGKVKHLKEITGFNIRIAREWKGVGEAVLPFLIDPLSGSVRHTLVVSPPGVGKTTLLRDITRLLSQGHATARGGFKVGVVDERSELAACVKGVPLFDLGPRTDVLDGCPKAEGMMMMIRSMSPEVLVADEIGRPEDASAVREALHAGISVIASAHGRDLADAKRRPILKELLEAGIFERIVVLERRAGEKRPRIFICKSDGARLDEQRAFTIKGGKP
ncbi:stage III sporulation protein AA [Paenibacillus sp. GD4]|nr:stage III sporulation protein AA [Paenibacillus sp. GD4]MDQ1909536.1 stage III sporulation protein AA [Paenibacillus sp. GD4]